MPRFDICLVIHLHTIHLSTFPSPYFLFREVEVSHWAKDIQTSSQEIERNKKCVSWNKELVYHKL